MELADAVNIIRDSNPPLLLVQLACYPMSIHKAMKMGKKQPAMAISSIEVEYQAAHTAAYEANLAHVDPRGF